MTNLQKFAAEAESDLHHSKSVSEKTWQIWESMSSEVRFAFVPAVGFLGRAAVQAQVDGNVTETDRIIASRLMLLKLGLDTDNPSWSSAVLDRLLAAVFKVPGGSVEDFFHALCSIFADYRCRLTASVANFIKIAVIECYTRYSASYQSINWPRFVERMNGGMTEPQCYLAFHAIPPQHLPGQFAQVIERALASSPYRDEVLASMAG